MRALQGLALVLVVGGALALSASAELHTVDYAGYDAVVTDSKGVTTEIEDFGFWTGPNILVGKRGDAKVEIPFRRIRTLEIKAYLPVKGYSPATVTTKKGKTYSVRIERFEGRRYLGGKTDFGTFRLYLMNISKLSLKKLSHWDEDRGEGRNPTTPPK